jgi:transposase
MTTAETTSTCSACQGRGEIEWEGEMLRCETCRGIWAGHNSGNPGPPGEPRPTPLDETPQELLARFRVLGLQLEAWRGRRGDDADTERLRISREIREAYDDARELGLYGREIAEALGVSRQQVYNIVNEVKQVRTPPRRDMFLVALTENQRDALLRVATGSTDPELAGAVTALERGRAVTLRTARQAVGQ